jgi:predicted GTPase
VGPVPQEGRDRAAFRSDLVAHHRAFADLPFLAVSAKTGEGLDDLFPLVARLEAAYDVRLATPALNGCSRPQSRPIRRRRLRAARSGSTMRRRRGRARRR